MKILKALIKKDKTLLQDLFASIDEVTKKKGNSLPRVKFAIPTKNGWYFLKRKSIAWDMLEDIMHQTEKIHTHCRRAEVAETLSRLINLSEKELLLLRMALL